LSKRITIFLGKILTITGKKRENRQTRASPPSTVLSNQRGQSICKMSRGLQ